MPNINEMKCRKTGGTAKGEATTTTTTKEEKQNKKSKSKA